MKKFLSFALIISAAGILFYAEARLNSVQQPATSAIVDPNFNVPSLARDFPALSGLPLSGGKYVLFRSVDTLMDQATGPLIRFNADGTLDTSFSFSRDYPDVTAAALLPDGKLIIAARHPIPYGVSRPARHDSYDILRVNTDGSIDPTFGPAQTTDGGQVRAITIAANGNIFVAGWFTGFNDEARQGIVRLLANGSLDQTFAAITLTSPPFPVSGPELFGVWAAPLVDATGRVVIGGDFIGVNGADRPGVARLNSDGTLDSTFVPSGFSPNPAPAGQPRAIRGLGIDSNGKVIIGGRFVVGSVTRVPILRLNTDGSRDTTYTHFTGILPIRSLSGIKNLVVLANNKVVAVDGSVWRFNADGTLDSGFYSPELLYAQECCAIAYTIALQPDGSFFINGDFTDLDDSGGPYFERWGTGILNADGTVRISFATSRRTGHKAAPNSFQRTADGSTLITIKEQGYLQFFAASYDPVPHNFGRLLSNGSVDPAFDPVASFNPNLMGPDFLLTGFTPLSDGSLLIAGSNEVDIGYGRLLPPDWTEDPNYNADYDVYSFDAAWPRSDGKVIVNSSWFAQRINADGSLDNSFTLDGSIGDVEYDQDNFPVGVYYGDGVIGLAPDNRLLMGYLTRDGLAHLVRLNENGSVDPTFPAQIAPVTFDYTGQYVTWGFPQTFKIRRSYVATDFPFKQAKSVSGNKTLIVGSFASFEGSPAHGIVRLNSDGSIDPTFNAGGGAQWTQTQETGTFHPSVDNVEALPNGQLLLTGTFEAFNGTPASGITLLNADGSVDGSFVPPVARQKYGYQPAYLRAQADGSFLLSGPYAPTGQTASPSFLRLLVSPLATSVVSRKTHGAAGNFDVNLPETGPIGVECRTGGVTNDYQIVATFSTAVTVNGNPQAQVTLGSADVGSGGVANGGAVSVAGNTVTIPLTNVANAQTINVTLSDVNNGVLSSNVTVPVSILVGDANGNGSVNASDVALTKSRIGQPVDSTNFRSDVNANGATNASDVGLIKAAIGAALP